ncbi:MAG: VOC family protein [Candidatus Binataceae bacterium]
MGAPFRVGEIDHVVVRCLDRARTLKFYTDVLGLKEERRIDAIGLIQLRAGAGMVDLVPAAERSENGRNVDHFCLGITTGDIKEVARWLRQRQAEVIGEPAMRYGARGAGLSVYVRDPEGNVIELKQIPGSI